LFFNIVNNTKSSKVLSYSNFIRQESQGKKKVRYYHANIFLIFFCFLETVLWGRNTEL